MKPDRLIDRSAALLEVPKPPWWKPMQRARWREECVNVALRAILAERVADD